jgi:DNA-binding transcriptional LysR family regulator
MVELHRLEGFYRVAVTGGYARAARAFPYPITQPAVHQQVSKLERELGVRLFERVGKDRMVPTSHGRALLTFCAPFFEQLPSVVRTLQDGTHGGVLRIDAAAMEIEYVLPLWIARLRKQRPDIRIDIEEVSYGDGSRLLRGETDLVVDYQPSLPEHVESRAIATYYTFIAAPRAWLQDRKRHLPLHKGAALLAKLADAPFVGFHPSMPHHAMQMAALREAGNAPQHTLSASSVNAILALVRAGLGYSLVPWPDTSGPRAVGMQAVRLTGPGTEFPVCASWRARSPEDPLVAAALSALA